MSDSKQKASASFWNFSLKDSSICSLTFLVPQ
jgi:hypothetical protein